MSLAFARRNVVKKDVHPCRIKCCQIASVACVLDPTSIAYDQQEEIVVFP